MWRPSAKFYCLVFTASLIPACADEAGAPTDAVDATDAWGDAPTEPDAQADASAEDATEGTGTGDPDLLVGSFQVQLVPPVLPGGPVAERDGYTQVVGKVYDGETPQAIVWEPTATDGDCVLLVPRVPFCETPCGGGAVCVEDDTCQDRPTAVPVGTVTLTGLHSVDGPAAIAMDPIANNYQPVGTALAYPAFADGDPIQLDAVGTADVSRFAIAASGVALLELTASELALNTGEPLTLGWQTAEAPTTIEVLLDISHHGGSKGKIECSTADDGELTVSAELVDALLDLGVAGYPTVIVERESIGSAVTDLGRVELVVGSRAEIAVTIDGVVSCTDDSQCPEGQTCQTDLLCR